MARIYLILGCSGGGRRTALAELAGTALDNGEPEVFALLPSGEPSVPADQTLASLPRLQVLFYPTDHPDLPLVPPQAATVFVLLPGLENPLDWIERLPAWMAAGSHTLGRVFTVVPCAQVEAHPPLRVWFEACIHFSDVVLLTQREGLNNRWVSDFVSHFKNRHYPCLFELVSKRGLPNPTALLFPEARRLSLLFDDEFEDLPAFSDEVESSSAEWDEPEETPVDPYLERLPGGQRARPLPDLRRLLRSPSP